MSKLHELLKAAAPLFEALNAPQEKTPQRIVDALNKVPIGRAVTVLNERQMRIVLLKILKETPGDGIEINAKLKELRVRLEAEGSGVIYGLLTNMAAEGLLQERLQAGTARIIYHLTDKGDALLERDGVSIMEMSGALRALWAS